MSNEDNLYGILFDYGRQARIGLPEAVFSQGKTLSALIALLEKFANGEPPILFTRLYEDRAKDIPKTLLERYDYDPVSGTAFARSLPQKFKASVALVSAGAADAPVSHECARTLQYLGIKYALFEDCGVAALWRVVQKFDAINYHDIIIVFAGMEGALASVVGGLSPKPIFAVPTSVGYGASKDGQAALIGMLSSCAPGIAVMNIDNGYGAACAAARIAGLL